MTHPDHLTIQEAVQRKAIGDAHFLHVLYTLNKLSLQGKNRYWIAGYGSGEAEGRALGTSLYDDWPKVHHDRYVTAFLSTWDELEFGESEEGEQKP